MKGNLEVINSFCKMFSRLDVAESDLYDSEKSCLIQPLYHAHEAAKYWRASSVSACFLSSFSCYEDTVLGQKVLRWASNGAVKWLKSCCKVTWMRLWNASYCGVFCIKLRRNRTWIAYYGFRSGEIRPVFSFLHFCLVVWVLSKKEPLEVIRVQSFLFFCELQSGLL